jgi:hypothetical protein
MLLTRGKLFTITNMQSMLGAVVYRAGYEAKHLIFYFVLRVSATYLCYHNYRRNLIGIAKTTDTMGRFYASKIILLL